MNAQLQESAPGAHAATYPVQRNNIFIVGPSGSGKTTSLRNLDPERTIILSTEQKALPFPGASRFRMLMPISSVQQFYRAFERALQSEHADTVVIDSFTSLSEFVYIELVRGTTKQRDDVYSSWLHYRDCLHDILLRSKQSNKRIIFIGIDTLMQDEHSRLIRSIDVQGSLKGKVEKEFTIVLWTKVFEPDPTNPQAERYHFATQSDGSTKAKSPMMMFDSIYIPNDLASVLHRVDQFEQAY